LYAGVEKGGGDAEGVKEGEGAEDFVVVVEF